MRKALRVTEQIVIDRRFRGPPDSANGGYSCGAIAAFVNPDPAIEVTLRAPPPLDTPLHAETARGEARLLDGESVIAEARPAAWPDLPLPSEVTLEEAEDARRDSPLWHHHAFPMCFVCGTDRPPEDGLGVTCGPIAGRDDVVASPWHTYDWMSNGDAVRPELLWSALDCPSGIAGMLVPNLGLTVLGQLTAKLIRPAETGRSYVAIGWPIGREGRKFEAGSAILDPEGGPVGIARATWIELREQLPGYGRPS
jgi:hypothetical protein